MITILIVEDNGEKLRKISSSLTSIAGVDRANIKHAGTIVEAKRLLTEIHFDLMILDVALPNHIDSEPVMDGGIQLLDAISGRNKFFMPTHIIAITQHQEVLDTASTKFSARLISTIKYDESSTEWVDAVSTHVSDLVAAKASSDALPRSYGCLLCVVCALREPELDAVLKNGWTWKSFRQPGDSTSYFQTILIRGDREFIIYAASAARMGMTAAAVLAEKMIAHFRPQYLCMAGIAAGVQGKVHLGDVVAADPAWDWGHGKWRSSASGPIFEIEPHQAPLDVSLRNLFEEIRQDAAQLLTVKNGWRGETPDNLLKLHIGPLASGAPVVSNKSIVSGVRQQHRKLIGIDMEAYSIFIAAQEAPIPRPFAFVLKSIVDFADSTKNDKYHLYSAYTSAELLRITIERIIDKLSNH